MLLERLAARVADEVLTFDRVEAVDGRSHQAAPADRGRRRDAPPCASAAPGRRRRSRRGRRIARSSPSGRTSATARVSCGRASPGWNRSSPCRRSTRPTRSAGPTIRALPQHGGRDRDHARPVRAAAPVPAHRGRGDASACRALGPAHPRRRHHPVRRRRRSTTRDLVVPHPLFTERRFVLHAVGRTSPPTAAPQGGTSARARRDHLSRPARAGVSERPP